MGEFLVLSLRWSNSVDGYKIENSEEIISSHNVHYSIIHLYIGFFKEWLCLVVL